MNENFVVLEDQIRDCFGRVAWTHKTHEKQADSYERKNLWLVWGKIIVTAFAATGGILSLISCNYWNVVSATLSTILLLINLIFENRNYAVLCNKHREIAVLLWNVRESYLSLLADIRSPNVDIEKIKKTRDELQEQLSKIYSSAPRTFGDAYRNATEALHGEELSFTNAEIDKMLPPQFRKECDK